jgi:hypothetical protein
VGQGAGRVERLDFVRDHGDFGTRIDFTKLFSGGIATDPVSDNYESHAFSGEGKSGSFFKQIRQKVDSAWARSSGVT